MKTVLTYLATLLFVVTQYSLGQEIKGNQIIVYGNAEVKATANQAELNFSVQGFGSSLRIAVDNAQKQAAETTKRLLDLGLKKSNLNTSHFYSGENYGSKPLLSSKKDFQAVITVFVAVDSLELLEPVIFALSESGVDNISNIGFSLKDNAALEGNAREQAINNAKQKAEAITRQLDMLLGKVIYVEELPSFDGQQSHESYRMKSEMVFYERQSFQQALRESIFAQTITVNAMIRMVFELNRLNKNLAIEDHMSDRCSSLFAATLICTTYRIKLPAAPAARKCC